MAHSFEDFFKYKPRNWANLVFGSLPNDTFER